MAANLVGVKARAKSRVGVTSTQTMLTVASLDWLDGQK